jgi:hypothetical protein
MRCWPANAPTPGRAGRGLSNNGTASGVSGLKAAGYRHRGRPAAGTIMSTRLSWRAGKARARKCAGTGARWNEPRWRNSLCGYDPSWWGQLEPP